MLVKAFSQASGVPASMLGHVLTAHTYVRQSSLLMARYCAGGALGAAPVASGFFQTYEAFFENDPEGFMPRDAALGASIQISEAIQFLGAQASLPVSLRSLPAGDAHAHHFLRRYLSMAGMWRAPAALRAGELSLEAATLGAALDSLAEGSPLVLLDAAFQDGDKLEIVVPLNPMTGCPDAQGLASRVAQGGLKLPFPPIVKIAMYPLL